MLYLILHKFVVFYRRLQWKYIKSRLAGCGENVTFEQGYIFEGAENITLGSHIYASARVMLLTTDSKLTIGNYAMLGQNLIVVTGDHRTDCIGLPMIEVQEKLPENDADVTIEDDVWIGANSTVLKGVTIGRGSIIAAGSVVTKSIPPYSICAGTPARVLKQRFTPEQIEAHEKLMKQRGKM